MSESGALTAEEHAEIAARWAEAAPGPWSVVLGSGEHMCTGVARIDYNGDTEKVTLIADCLPDYALQEGIAPLDHRPTMEAIAHAPTDIARLLAATVKMTPPLVAEVGEREPAIANWQLRAAMKAWDEGTKGGTYNIADVMWSCLAAALPATAPAGDLSEEARAIAQWLWESKPDWREPWLGLDPAFRRFMAAQVREVLAPQAALRAGAGTARGSAE